MSSVSAPNRREIGPAPDHLTGSATLAAHLRRFLEFGFSVSGQRGRGMNWVPKSPVVSARANQASPIRFEAFDTPSSQNRAPTRASMDSQRRWPAADASNESPYPSSR